MQADDGRVGDDRRRRAGATIQLAMKVAVAVGRGAPLRRRRSRHPADRRARRPPDRRPRGRRAARARRARSCSTQSALESLGDRVEIARARATIRASARDMRRRRPADGRRRRQRRHRRRGDRCPRTSCGRGCCPPSTSACARAAASSWPSCGPRSRCSCASAASTTTTTTTRSTKLDDFVRRAQRILDVLRRQPAAADARRQGRLPLRRLRLAAGARGRRRARGRRGARAARPWSDRPRRATSRSASRTAGCAAAPTVTRMRRRSPASATPSTSRRG